MGIIDRFEEHKRQVEGDIREAEEAAPDFLGQKDVTESFKERLRAARDAYAEAIDCLKAKAGATGAIRPGRAEMK